MFNARETIGGEALSVYNLDDPPSQDVLDAILDDERVIDVSYISLNGAAEDDD
jgi:D-3-phosphoglycerate dehydrogenase